MDVPNISASLAASSASFFSLTKKDTLYLHSTHQTFKRLTLGDSYTCTSQQQPYFQNWKPGLHFNDKVVNIFSLTECPFMNKTYIKPLIYNYFDFLQ